MDRLEKEVADLRRNQEAQIAEAGTRAQTTVALEEYRTRAQQALKRANEVTSLTAAENKRLEVNTGTVSSTRGIGWSGCVVGGECPALLVERVTMDLTSCIFSWCTNYADLRYTPGSYELSRASGNK